MTSRRNRLKRYEDPVLDGGNREISGIESDPRAAGYLIVEMGGARFASLPGETIQELGLVVGAVLDEPGYARLSRVAAVEGAYHVATRLLAARPRSVAEMLRQLRDRGHGADAASEAVDRLEGEGLLDDIEFSRHFARVRSDKGHGAARLISDLLGRGVEKRIAEQAVRETLEAEAVDPIAQARELAEKRAAQLGDLPPEKKRRRLMAYLKRRGHWGYEIDRLVRETIYI